MIQAKTYQIYLLKFAFRNFNSIELKNFYADHFAQYFFVCMFVTEVKQHKLRTRKLCPSSLQDTQYLISHLHSSLNFLYRVFTLNWDG